MALFQRAHAVVAEAIETQGHHLALIDSQGGLAALFLVELVESWNVLPSHTYRHLFA
jgi:hypothetical protein